jgi:hypothetical protein
MPLRASGTSIVSYTPHNLKQIIHKSAALTCLFKQEVLAGLADLFFFLTSHTALATLSYSV